MADSPDGLKASDQERNTACSEECGVLFMLSRDRMPMVEGRDGVVMR